MNGVDAAELRAILKNVKPAVPAPTWDFVAYSRFLAPRVPEEGAVAAPDLARLAEELLAELKEGIDRRTGAVFDPPLVSGRSDLVYNDFREKLALVAAKVGGAEYAAAVAAGLKPVLPPAKSKGEEARTGSAPDTAAPAKAGRTPAPSTPAPGAPPPSAPGSDAPAPA